MAHLFCKIQAMYEIIHGNSDACKICLSRRVCYDIKGDVMCMTSIHICLWNVFC